MITQHLNDPTDTKTLIERGQKTLDRVKDEHRGKRYLSLRDPKNPTAVYEVEVGKYRRHLKHYAAFEVVGEGEWK